MVVVLPSTVSATHRKWPVRPLWFHHVTYGFCLHTVLEYRLVWSGLTYSISIRMTLIAWGVFFGVTIRVKIRVRLVLGVELRLALQIVDILILQIIAAWCQYYVHDVISLILCLCFNHCLSPEILEPTLLPTEANALLSHVWLEDEKCRYAHDVLA